MNVRMNVARFQAQLRAEADKLHAATRPAAQAGAQIIYDRAKINAPISEKEHYFYIDGRKYGPYAPGNLRDSIYQVFSKTRSYKDVSTYHISFNKEDAPYGFMVEMGNSRAPARSFIGSAVAETRAQVREAIKRRFVKEVER